MNATALYYMLSSIAQALAGALGVLAAFAVLALTRIEADIRAGRAAMFQLKNPGFDALWDEAVEAGVEKFGEFVKKWFPDLTDADLGSDTRWRQVRSGVEAVPHQRVLHCRLKAASVSTGIAIAVSLLMLPLVPTFSCSWGWSVFVSVVTLGLAIVSVWFYGAVVLATIRGGEEITKRRRR